MRLSLRTPFNLHSAFAPLCLLSLTWLAVSPAGAQSGRRAQPSSPPATQESPPPIPHQAQTGKVEKQHLLFVAKAAEAPTVPLGFPELYRDSVTNRLRDSISLQVSPAEDLRRDKAREKARTEKDAYVVWLQIEGRMDGNTSARYRDVESLRLRYEVFAPGTGATFTYGTVHPRALARPLNRIGVQVSYPTLCYPNLPLADFALLEASLEVADRIMNKLKVPLPRRCGE